MLDCLTQIEISPAVSSLKIVDFKSGESFYFLKLEVGLIDDSLLFIREFLSQKEHSYSYHWQRPNGEIIRRWDNAPHHPYLETYPHHIHIEGSVLSSRINSIQDVIKAIEDIILR